VSRGRGEVGVVDNPPQLLGDTVRREDEIDGRMEDGAVRPGGLQAGGEPEHITGDGHGHIGRHHIDLARRHRHAVLNLPDRQQGDAGEQLREDASVGRIQVLDEDQGEADPGGQMLEHLRAGF
jgi:hypothetical protein